MKRALVLVQLLTAFAGLACESEQIVAKRKAPFGFTGVRGKKSITDSVMAEMWQQQGEQEPSVDRHENTPFQEKRLAPSGFMGMRGKKDFLDSKGDRNNYTKRRAPSGFLGMRGKKMVDLHAYDGNTWENLVPALVSMGLRENTKSEEVPSFGAETKRAPSGFLGMRGKKETNEDEDDVDDDDLKYLKRAPQMAGFFGMRGKKQPSRSAFFGTRGKKYPYEFRGKFVGVRGKKSFTGDTLSGDLDISQLMVLLAQNDKATRNDDAKYFRHWNMS